MLYEQYAIYLRRKISKSDFLSEIGFDDIKKQCYEKMERNFYKKILEGGMEDYYLNRYRKARIIESRRII